MSSCTETISRTEDVRGGICEFSDPCKIHSGNPCAFMHHPCSIILVKMLLQLNIGEQLVSNLSLSEL